MLEYDLSILGEPIKVPSKPHSGAIIVSPGRMKINAKPIFQILEIGFITCNKKMNVIRMSRERAIEKSKNQLLR
jgi:hypothetical protein